MKKLGHKIDFILLSVLGLGSTFYVLGLSGHFTVQVPASYVCVEKHSHGELMTLQNKSFGGDIYFHQKRWLVLFCGSHKKWLIIYCQCLSEC